jgi:hypothetical protein
MKLSTHLHPTDRRRGAGKEGGRGKRERIGYLTKTADSDREWFTTQSLSVRYDSFLSL